MQPYQIGCAARIGPDVWSELAGWAAMQAVGEPWVAALETTEYGALPLATRLGMLGSLVQLALEGPSARAALEGRLEEAARVRKAMAEDAKVRPLQQITFPLAQHARARMPAMPS